MADKYKDAWAEHLSYDNKYIDYTADKLGTCTWEPVYTGESDDEIKKKLRIKKLKRILKNEITTNISIF